MLNKPKILLLALLCILVMSWPSTSEQKSAQNYRWQKLDVAGNSVAIKMGPWACATDNRTQLTWEVKSWHENQQYYKATYSYYDPIEAIGVKNGGSCQQGSEWYPCDITKLINQLNQQNYCGRNNWRLPTSDELKTLFYDKNTKGKLRINPYIFPRTTRNLYMTANRQQKDGRETITMVEFLHGTSQNRYLDVVANARLVSSSN